MNCKTVNCGKMRDTLLLNCFCLDLMMQFAKEWGILLLSHLCGEVRMHSVYQAHEARLVQRWSHFWYLLLQSLCWTQRWLNDARALLEQRLVEMYKQACVLNSVPHHSTVPERGTKIRCPPRCCVSLPLQAEAAQHLWLLPSHLMGGFRRRLHPFTCETKARCWWVFFFPVWMGYKRLIICSSLSVLSSRGEIITYKCESVTIIVHTPDSP